MATTSKDAAGDTTGAQKGAKSAKKKDRPKDRVGLNQVGLNQVGTDQVGTDRVGRDRVGKDRSGKKRTGRPGGKKAGARDLFELPFAVEAPRLADPEVGIDKIVLLAGRSHDRDITLLDTPDHRLMRAGITLAHRVENGLGEWFLDAPEWAPWLPTGHVEQVAAADDLPADMAFLVRPFRRMAGLGPVAALELHRGVYDLADAEGTSLGTLTDERVTVRRGGLTTSRHREATIDPSPAMRPAARRFLVKQLEAVGGVPVSGFSSELRRLAGPGGRLTDFPEPVDHDASEPLELVVGSQFAERLRAVLRADLALRAGQLAADEKAAAQQPPVAVERLSAEPVLSELAGVGRLIRALSGVLEPTWRERLEGEIGTVLAADPAQGVAALDEHFYGVVDALVGAARAPQLGDFGHRKAGAVLRQQAQSGLSIIGSRGDALTTSSPTDRWDGARQAAEQLAVAIAVLGPLFGKPGKKLDKHARQAVKLLRRASRPTGEPELAQVAAMTPEQAYRLGLRVAEDRREVAAARLEFIEEWPRLRRKLLADRA